MNRPQAELAITNEFISEFNETTAVTFDNQSSFYYCTSPITGTTKPSDNPWVKFSVKFNTSYQRTLGKKPYRRWRRPGIVHVNVNTPEGTGSYDGSTLCEEIISIFEGERLGEIVFYAGDYEKIGIVDGYYLYNIVIFFMFDEER